MLSSRVRLARNLEGRRFPHRADEEERRAVFSEVAGACKKAPSLGGAQLWDLEALPARDRRIFLERHLASHHLVNASGARGVVVGRGEAQAVMVNEEDHLRIQSVASGLNLPKALAEAVLIDRELETKLAYALSKRRGYLTACPTNVGTGLRASVLIHLPALTLASEVKKVHRAVNEMGMVVRGWFGEGSGSLGDCYQVSNQRTLGRTEEELVEELERVARRVLALETEAREKLRESECRRRRIEDRIHRAYATLRSARLMSVEQVMACASDVRLGKWFGFFDAVPTPLLNRLALFCQPAHLGRRAGRNLEGDEANWVRAEWVRSEFDTALGRTSVL
jgi:protein arginine kinase